MVNKYAENARELSVDVHEIPEGEYVGGTDGHNRYWLTDTQIVRCRGCENLCEHNDAIGNRLLCDLHEYFWVTPDSFCSWGKIRKDNNSER